MIYIFVLMCHIFFFVGYMGVGDRVVTALRLARRNFFVAFVPLTAGYMIYADYTLTKREKAARIIASTPTSS